MESTLALAVFNAKVPSDFPRKFPKVCDNVYICCKHTSSNFSAIIANALKIASVAPVMVTILSGDDPSDMLIRARLWKYKFKIILSSICR